MTVAPAAIVVVEGLFVSRAGLAPLVDVTVLVETDAGVRRRRQLARADPEEWLARWDAAERLWFTSVRPPESFDLVVRGAGSADGA